MLIYGDDRAKRGQAQTAEELQTRVNRTLRGMSTQMKENWLFLACSAKGCTVYWQRRIKTFYTHIGCAKNRSNKDNKMPKHISGLRSGESALYQADRCKGDQSLHANLHNIAKRSWPQEKRRETALRQQKNRQCSSEVLFRECPNRWSHSQEATWKRQSNACAQNYPSLQQKHDLEPNGHHSLPSKSLKNE